LHWAQKYLVLLLAVPVLHITTKPDYAPHGSMSSVSSSGRLIAGKTTSVIIRQKVVWLQFQFEGGGYNHSCYRTTNPATFKQVYCSLCL